MAVTVTIPTPLRKTTRDERMVTTEAGNILSIIEQIDATYPGFKERMCDESGRIRRFVNVYVNSDDIRYLGGPEAKVKDGDEVTIIPAIAGG